MHSLQTTVADLWNIYILKSLINPCNIAYTITIKTLLILNRSKETCYEENVVYFRRTEYHTLSCPYIRSWSGSAKWMWATLVHLAVLWHYIIFFYPIPRCILKILEKLSTFTFRQPTRWVGLTNSKSPSLCQSTIPNCTKLDLLYFGREIHIPPSIVRCNRSQMNTTTSIKKTVLSNVPGATDENV